MSGLVNAMVAGLVLKGTAVLTMAWLGSMLMRRRPAAERHALWCAAVMALALLPWLGVALPALRVTVPRAMASNAVYRLTVDAAPTPQSTPAAAPSSGAAAATALRPLTPARAVLWMWAAGAMASLWQLALGLVSLARTRRHSRPLDAAAWEVEMQAARGALGVRRTVMLVETSRAGVPMTAGVLRPVIYLPPAAEEWDAARRSAVLLHEVAHIRRHDALTWVCARLVLCGWWFHPLAWVAASALLREREKATDDMVLGAGARPSDYAGHLVGIARGVQSPAPAAWAAACMARASHLEGRVAAILSPDQARSTVRPALAAATMLGALLVVAPLAAMRPQAGPPVVPATQADVETLARTALQHGDYALLERTAATLAIRRMNDEADRLSAAALEARASRFGLNSLEYAEGLVEQGKLRRLQVKGKWEQAEPLYQRALAIQEAAGAVDPATLDYLAPSAAHPHKDYEKSIALYQRALSLKPDAAERGRLLTGLGMVEAETGRQVDAEGHYQAALASLDQESQDAATARELYARLLLAAGRTGEAAPFNAEAARVRATSVARANLRLPDGGTASKLDGETVRPKLLSKVEPNYTEVARIAELAGTVQLNVTIGADGSVYSLTLKQGLGLGLDEAAEQAIRLWRFQPATKGGVPVACIATIEVNFRLL